MTQTMFTESLGVEGECFNCGSSIPIAVWDDAAMSGKVAVYCKNCTEHPETNLWEAESDSENHELVDIPELPESEDWIVLDHHRNWESQVLERYGCEDVQELQHMLDENDPLNLTADEVLKKPENSWEIVVHSFDDEEAIKEARNEIRERL